MEDRRAQDAEPSQLLVPAVVCVAFSIEVGLKALLKLQGTPLRVHPLFKLYEALSPKMQRFLALNTALPQEAFEARLRGVSTAFLDWRYAYEDAAARSTSLEFLVRLAYAVQDAISTAVNEI